MYLRCLLLGLTACFSLNLILAGQKNAIAQPSNPKGFDLETWSSRCEQLKKDLAKEQAINVIYQPRPAKNDIKPSWELNWNGQRAPIPAIQYSEVFVTHTSLENRIVLLNGSVNGQEVRVLLGSQPSLAPIVDIFSAFEVAQTEPQSTPEGQALTTKLFGGPVTENQLGIKAYDHKLADLTCKKDQWEKEVPIAMALTLKPVAEIYPPKAVYRFDGGYITQFQDATQEIWTARWSDQRRLSDVMFQLPKGQRYGKLALGMNQSNWQAAPNPPKWLNALETALKKPEKRNWQALAQAMRAAKMSKKSIDSVQRIINAK